MSVQGDTRLQDSKAIPMDEVIARLGIEGLRRQGHELVGPCPNCGGRDRFAVNTRTNMFLCRQCQMKGGDQVALVCAVLGCSFPDGLKYLVGEAVELDPAEREKRLARAREAEAKRATEAAQYRERVIRFARQIWVDARGARNGLLRAYLCGRGLPAALVDALPDTIRFCENLPYRRKIGGQLVTLHWGPAMVARIDTPGAEVSAVHCTWIDPARAGKKAVIKDVQGQNKGEDWPAKLIFGSKKGGVIRLAHGARDTDVMVMGEGIETTLTAYAAGAIEGAAYWAGVDLGNMAGRMQRVAGKRYSGLPDMSDADAFVPPDWVRRLVFIQDGDSDAAMTRAKLVCGLRRAMELRPGLRGQIVHAGQGVDLNDIVSGGFEQGRGA